MHLETGVMTPAPLMNGMVCRYPSNSSTLLPMYPGMKELPKDDDQGKMQDDQDGAGYIRMGTDHMTYAYPDKTMKFYEKVNREFEVASNGTLNGWIPVSIVAAYTGIHSPNIRMQIDLYWSDA